MKRASAHSFTFARRELARAIRAERARARAPRAVIRTRALAALDAKIRAETKP